jgi:hypothetical protein
VAGLPHRYDATITVDSDGGRPRNPAEFAVAPKRAATARSASAVSAHATDQVVSIVTVLAADQLAVVALAVVSGALRCPVTSSIR